MCEPKTLNLYLRMEELKGHLESMYGNNADLIRNLRDRSVIPEESKDLVNRQFESFKNLELKVLEYIGMARLHC